MEAVLAFTYSVSRSPKQITDVEAVWIGLNELGTTRGDGIREFRWSDGTQVTYTNWASGEGINEPNANHENCACYWHYQTEKPFRTLGTWNDFFCGRSEPFVCVSRPYSPRAYGPTAQPSQPRLVSRNQRSHSFDNVSRTMTPTVSPIEVQVGAPFPISAYILDDGTGVAVRETIMVTHYCRRA